MIFASGATVYLVCRNKERGEAALSEIQTRTGNQNVYLEVSLFFPIFQSLIVILLFSSFELSKA